MRGLGFLLLWTVWVKLPLIPSASLLNCLSASTAPACAGSDGDGQGANGEELEQVVRFHHYFSLSGWVWRKVSARQNNHTGGVTGGLHFANRVFRGLIFDRSESRRATLPFQLCAAL